MFVSAPPLVMNRGPTYSLSPQGYNGVSYTSAPVQTIGRVGGLSVVGAPPQFYPQHQQFASQQFVQQQQYGTSPPPQYQQQHQQGIQMNQFSPQAQINQALSPHSTAPGSNSDGWAKVQWLDQQARNLKKIVDHESSVVFQPSQRPVFVANFNEMDVVIDDLTGALNMNEKHLMSNSKFQSQLTGFSRVIKGAITTIRGTRIKKFDCGIFACCVPKIYPYDLKPNEKLKTICDSIWEKMVPIEARFILAITYDGEARAGGNVGVNVAVNATAKAQVVEAGMTQVTIQHQGSTSLRL